MNKLADKDRLAGKDRLIVALDVSDPGDAISLVQTLKNVSFFKINPLLFFTGRVIDLVHKIREERGEGHVFLDIKWGGDIENTVTDFIQACVTSSIVKFITLIEAENSRITDETIKTGKAVRRANNSEYPHFLMVPLFSSLDSVFLKQKQVPKDVDDYILNRGQAMLELGCDGLIVSGNAIRLCRNKFGRDIDIVSPAIRPAGTSHDDHKRFTTPSEAIEMGADYLVVGRPIIKAEDKYGAAQQIIEEIDRALEKCSKSHSGSSGGPSAPRQYLEMTAKSK